MKRGEVWWVNFSAVGGEIRKKRPAVIVSNDAANKHLNRVQVVPLTSQTGRVYPSEALVTFAGKQGKAMAD
jgi:mRNA interferase MazF